MNSYILKRVFILFSRRPLNVAEAFMELVDDTTKNGQALIVSNSNGRVYCDFPQIDMY